MMTVNRYMPLVDYSLILASAPGRFVLMGEFADLFEKNCIAMTIDRRINVSIKPYKEGRLRLNLKNFDMIREWPTTSIGMNRLINKFGDYLDYNEKIPTKLNHLLHKRYYQTQPPSDCPSPDEKSAPLGSKTRQADDATMAFLILYAALGDSFAKSARPPLDIEISSNIPINQGLGSSSAYAVALTAALMKVFRISAEPYVISNWALHIDKFFHNHSSGLSSSTIIHGGYCYHQHNKVKGYGIRHSTQIKVMLIDTGEVRYPKSINEYVNTLVKEDNHRVNNIFVSISEMVGAAWRSINQVKFHPRMISGFLESNQTALDSLGLSFDRFQEIREIATSLRLTVKQTHCGGTAFLLYDESDIEPQLNEFRDILRDRDISFEDYDICYAGLQVSKVDSPSD